MTKITIKVMPKLEILDPQGKAILNAINKLGYTGIAQVRQGKSFDIELDESFSKAQLPEIISRLLVNNVIEDYEIIEGS